MYLDEMLQHQMFYGEIREMSCNMLKWGLEVFANSYDSKRLVNLYSPARSFILCLLIAHGPYIVCGNSKCLNRQAGLGIYCFHMHLAPFCMLQLKYHHIFFKRSVLFLCKIFVNFYIIFFYPFLI